MVFGVLFPNFRRRLVGRRRELLGCRRREHAPERPAELARFDSVRDVLNRERVAKMTNEAVAQDLEKVGSLLDDKALAGARKVRATPEKICAGAPDRAQAVPQKNVF